MSNWKEALKSTSATLALFEQVFSQVPVEVQPFFEAGLNKMCETKCKFQYLILSEDGEVVGGTNDEDLADAAEQGDYFVIHLSTVNKQVDVEYLGLDGDSDD